MRNAILIEKYQSLYDHHNIHHNVFHKMMHFLLPHAHHEAIIDTSKIESPALESLSESQKVDRSLYALWKIRQVNHHFFPPSEQDILDNREYRIVRRSVKNLTSFGIVGYMIFNVHNGRLNLKRSVYAASAYLLMRGILFGTEIFYDKAKMPSRRKLARKYIDAYGYDYLYKLSLPTYPLHEIAHAHNILQ